ncbi:hypothetical protein SCP_1102410 [Sparassis crispa]|uniref:Uncharacterized protein n=1 Tax=Sparassis crispa TaxID=139825 RepID=A0A401GZH1_9APHY|nr:hypothetical protein SCP_1102410 [Sparassis crispa]GBE87564.1 hypothetical protein SCP_1102410 [Sparassis crispa]
MKADFAAQLTFGNVATLKSFGDWPVYIPRKTSSVIKFPETFSPTTSEGGYERTLSSRDSMKATWDKQERYENDSCPDISSVLDNPPSFSVGLSTTNQNMPSVLSRDRSVEHVEKNQSARSTPSPAADSSIVATPSHPLIYINAVSSSLLCFGQPKASHPNTRTRFPVSPDIDYLRAPPVNWAPHAVQELEPATEEASDISNVSRKAFILSAPPRGSGIGIGRAIDLGKGVGPVSRGVEAAAMIRSTLAPTGLGANSLRVVPDREESRYPTMSSPKTLKYEMLPVPPPVVTRRRPVGIIYGGSGSRSL